MVAPEDIKPDQRILSIHTKKLAWKAQMIRTFRILKLDPRTMVAPDNTKLSGQRIRCPDNGYPRGYQTIKTKDLYIRNIKRCPDNGYS